MNSYLSANRIANILFTLFVCAWLALAGFSLSGCASSDDRRPASFGDLDLDENSNAHPAAYLVDRFPVNRPMPKHKSPNNEPFYFKRCSEVGGEWPYSRTSYDCHYP